MVFDREAFERDRHSKAIAQAADLELQDLALKFVTEADRYDYPYQWTWLGLPILQLPSDIVMTQEIIWRTQPDLIIETGIAWGGSIALYATLLQLLGRGQVVGIDLHLYEHVEKQVMDLPVGDRIRLLKGDSTSPEVRSEVENLIEPGSKVMVLLDSSHTHDHVLEELRTYAPFVTVGQYVVVSDTIVEYLPPQEHRPRPWGPGSNPKTALDVFLKENDSFSIDEEVSARLLETLTPGGYIKRVR